MPKGKLKPKKAAHPKKASIDKPAKKTRAIKAGSRRARTVKGDSFSFTVKVDDEALAASEQIAGKVAFDDVRKARTSARQHIRRLALDQITESLSLEDKFLFAHSCEHSDASLPGYSTLDEKHVADIERLISQITAYADDASRMRPLNFLMLASPGAGKSHFIDCVAKKLSSRGVTAITFNMASMSTSDDLVRPLDEARNAKVEDKLPLLFLDEFDSSAAYYGLLLPLLWDGGLSLGQRDLKLGKIVIVLAGSHPSLPETLSSAKGMISEVVTSEGVSPKLIDLLSRVNGSVVNIPPFSAPGQNTDRRTDKVAIASQLLRKRFGDKLYMVPLALLRLIATTDFRYGVRSIAHMLDLIPYKKPSAVLSLSQLGLPLSSPAALRESSLAYHVIDDENQAHGIIDSWKVISKCTELVPITSNVLFMGSMKRGGPESLFHKIQIGTELQRIVDASSEKPSRPKNKSKKPLGSRRKSSK